MNILIYFALTFTIVIMNSSNTAFNKCFMLYEPLTRLDYLKTLTVTHMTKRA